MRRLPAFPAKPAQLDLFMSHGGDIAARDAQDLIQNNPELFPQ